ncbi:hypothetical protein THRCLA_07962 [Thraustotheca clavata]|uniref:Uncharacterized protein n=1 Tax=Thraustotheca clavata TaxID=74557 RepID=A0A1V9ZBW9_9STRA|nr:hypothetical protein THRCLA_07962 [Thraustotheca clavata]
MDLAAMNGHFDIVKFLHYRDNGPGCTTRAIDGAATYGHINIVQFLVANRSEGFTTLALRGAVQNGYSKIVEYLMHRPHEQTFDEYFIPIHRVECRQAAEGKDYLGVLKCLCQPSFPNICQYDMPHTADFCPMHCISEENIYAALKDNPIPTLEYVHQNNIIAIASSKMLEIVVKIGHAQSIRYVLEAIFRENDMPISLLDQDNAPDPWTPVNYDVTPCQHWSGSSPNYLSMLSLAVANGDFDTVKLLHRTGIKFSSYTAMDKAAEIGRLDIIKWLHTYRTEGCSFQAMPLAVKGGHKDVVKWFYEVKHFKCTANSLKNAIANGDITMLKFLISIPMTQWIHKRHYTSYPIAMDTAIYCGHLEMVEYLHKYRNGCCSDDAFSSAVYGNRLDILKYLVENNCLQGDIDYEILCINAAGGNVDMLMYCVDHFPIELEAESKQRMMYKAICRGLLNNVKWLYEVKGFEWIDEMIEAAIERRHEKIIDYLYSTGDPQVGVFDDCLYMFE